jgi:hypothetical protein
MKEQILKIIEAVHQLYPYQVVGVRETYSHYNQGWQDACDAMEQGLSDYSPWVSVEDAEPKVFKSRKGDFAAYLFCDVNADCPVPLYGRYVGEHRFLTLGNIEKVATHYMEMPEPPKAK